MTHLIPPGIRHSVHSVFKSAVESVSSVPRDGASSSNDGHVSEKGTLAPDDFVKAGDFLVETCPTWKWQKSGSAATRKTYLPEEKQYLVTRNVPCRKRAKAMEEYCGKETALSGEDDGWVEAGNNVNGETTTTTEKEVDDEIPDISRVNIEEGEEEEVKNGEEENDDDDDDDDDESIPDMEDVEEEDAILIAAPKKEKNNEDLLRTRTYDVSITWDLYYQTPRVWLNGYDEQKNSLAPKSVYEDISADHAKKTVTIDPHPHTNVSSASVHPCKHASVMKKLVKMITSGEEENEKLSVERYLVVFLKFMQSAMPTIEYDFTTNG